MNRLYRRNAFLGTVLRSFGMKVKFLLARKIIFQEDFRLGKEISHQRTPRQLFNRALYAKSAFRRSLHYWCIEKSCDFFYCWSYSFLGRN